MIPYESQKMERFENSERCCPICLDDISLTSSHSTITIRCFQISVACSHTYHTHCFKQLYQFGYTECVLCHTRFEKQCSPWFNFLSCLFVCPLRQRPLPRYSLVIILFRWLYLCTGVCSLFLLLMDFLWLNLSSSSPYTLSPPQGKTEVVLASPAFIAFLVMMGIQFSCLILLVGWIFCCTADRDVLRPFGYNNVEEG